MTTKEYSTASKVRSVTANTLTSIKRMHSMLRDLDEESRKVLLGNFSKVGGIDAVADVFYDVEWRLWSLLEKAKK